MEHESVSKAEVFRRLRDSQHLVDETVSIVEAKTGKSSFKAIGQLEAYKILLEEDYGWEVKEQILLSEERDEVINHIGDEKGFNLVSLKS